MEKIFKQKIFNYFVWTPLGSRVNTYINFCLQVPFEMSAALYCSHYLSLLATGDTDSKFSTGINNTNKTGGKIGTPTKRQVSKRQVSKRLVSKRPVSNVRFTKRQVYKTSGFKTSGFKTSSF